MNKQTEKLVGLALMLGIASYLFSLGSTPWFITASILLGMFAVVLVIVALIKELSEM